MADYLEYQIKVMIQVVGKHLRVSSGYRATKKHPRHTILFDMATTALVSSLQNGS